MTPRFRFGLFLCIFLIAGVFIAGCSDQQAADSVTPVPATAALAKYSAGDIIGKSSSATDSMLYVIISYDPVTDLYERAWIYKNNDGSWGHRIDTRTDTGERTLIEKVYPVKVSHVTIGSVPVITTAIPTVTEITYSAKAPSITKISPTTGAKTSSPSITITGENFQSGAVVKLVQPGVSTVSATGVSVPSATTITCTFSLGTFEKGNANIIVMNPDGQTASLANAFTIGEAVPVISSVSPSTLTVNEGPVNLAITGQNFKDPVRITLTKDSAELVCLNPNYQDATKVFCDISIPSSAATGDWSLNIMNIADQQKSTWATPFKITNST